MKDYANPAGAPHPSLRWGRDAADGWIRFCWNVWACDIPLTGWHHNSSRSLNVWRMISWRNWLCLPITSGTAAFIVPVWEEGAGGQDSSCSWSPWLKTSRSLFAVLGLLPGVILMSEREAALNGVLHRGLNHSSWLLVLKRTACV